VEFSTFFHIFVFVEKMFIFFPLSFPLPKKGDKLNNPPEKTDAKQHKKPIFKGFQELFHIFKQR